MIRLPILILALVLFHLSISYGDVTPFSKLRPDLPPKIKINSLVNKEVLSPGEKFRFYLSLEIQEGWHIYSIQPLDGNGVLATQINLNDKTFEDVTLWNESATQLMHDGAQAKIVKGHISTAEFSKQFRVSDKMTSGNYPIRGNLIYRACDNRMCTLPQSLFFESWIRIGR